MWYLFDEHMVHKIRRLYDVRLVENIIQLYQMCLLF